MNLPGFETVAAPHDGTRRADDYYPTPGWCVEELVPLLAYRTLRGPVLEPAIGHGAIASVLARYEDAAGRRWWVSGVDINPGLVAECNAKGLRSACLDFLNDPVTVGRWATQHPFARVRRELPVAVVANPPYRLALEFAEAAISAVDPEVGVVAFLVRQGFLSSKRRSAFWREHRADLLFLDERPSFTGGGSASDDYVWCLWPGSGPDGRGMHWRCGDVTRLQSVESSRPRCVGIGTGGDDEP